MRAKVAFVDRRRELELEVTDFPADTAPYKLECFGPIGTIRAVKGKAYKIVQYTTPNSMLGQPMGSALRRKGVDYVVLVEEESTSHQPAERGKR